MQYRQAMQHAGAAVADQMPGASQGRCCGGKHSGVVVARWHDAQHTPPGCRPLTAPDETAHVRVRHTKVASLSAGDHESLPQRQRDHRAHRATTRADTQLGSGAYPCGLASGDRPLAPRHDDVVEVPVRVGEFDSHA